MNKEFYTTYKYRLYPNEYQKQKIDGYIAACSFVYNKLLKLSIRKTTPNVTSNDLLELKNTYKWINDYNDYSISKQIVFVNNRQTTPHKKCKGSFNINLQKVYIENNKIYIKELNETIKIKQHRYLPTDYDIVYTTILKDYSNKYYICICIKTLIPIKKNKQSNVVSICIQDLSNIYVLGVDYKKLINPPFDINTYYSKLNKYSDKLDNKIKYSNKWYSTLNKKRSIMNHYYNKIRYYLNDVALNIVINNDIIIINQLVSSKTLQYNIEFINILKHKAYKLDKTILIKNIITDMDNKFDICSMSLNTYLNTHQTYQN